MPDADVTKLSALTDLNGTLADRVYAAVKAAILSLEFAPGAMIRKHAVCDHLGVSRSPVSDALSKLSNEGLVDIVPQSGTRVARLSMAAIREDAFLREALEVAAAQRAALYRSEELLARLNRNIEVQKMLLVDLDREDFMKTDSALHDLIMSATRVTRLPGVVRTLSQHVERARILLVPEPGRLSETLDEHIEIVAAIAARDGDRAQEAMRVHLQEVLNRLAPLEAARPDLFST